MAGVEEVVVQEPSRGRDANPSRSRKDKSRDAASILESRLARIELAIADSRERLDVLEQCVERDIGDLKERIEDLRGDMQFSSTSGREAQEGNEIFQARLENTVMGKLAEFETLLEDMRDDWALCKRAGEVISLIKEGLQHDSLGKSLVGLATDGKTKRFWVQDDLLYTVGNRLYVPKFGNLRKNLIKECHDTNPFELATGQQPFTPQTVMVGYTGRSPGSYKLAKDWQEQADIARSYLDKAARKMKKWADKKRRRVEFQVGDLVLVKLLPQQFKAFRKVHKGLVRKYEGPFPILKKVGKVSYKVELPQRLKIHPVFHVSHLKPYHADTEDPSRGESSRAPTAVVTSYDKEVEEILADRVVRKRGVPRSSEYLIKWKGLPTSEATWEPKEALWQFAKQIEEFHKETTTRTSPD
ncbi:hypothetical protein ACOSQ4_018409 [Xanthoceras sorbifolium]